MHPDKIVLLATLIIAIFSFQRVSAEYVEGIDTTDGEGFGLDSAFQVTSDGKIQSCNYLPYGMVEASGFFNCSFDDIKYAAAFDPFLIFDPPDIVTCFVIKKSDSTYSKIQLLERLQDNRTVFKFGSNTVPFDRTLEKPDYDRSIRYKPNNVIHYYHYSCPGNPRTTQDDRLYWDPPLPNDNHLLGYVLYLSREQYQNVDTTGPVSSIEWDSVAFAAAYTESFMATADANGILWRNYHYLNFAAVYEEEKSDLIQGWTLFKSTAVGINRPPARPGQRKDEKTIISLNGCTVTLPQECEHALLTVNSLSGRRIAALPYQGRSLSLNGIHRNMPSGRYLLRAEFPDRTDMTLPFTIRR